MQAWRLAAAPDNDKFQYTNFAHKINSFDTAPRKLLASDSRLRPDRYALEKGDLSKSGAEKSRSVCLCFVCVGACTRACGQLHAVTAHLMRTTHLYSMNYIND